MATRFDIQFDRAQLRRIVDDYSAIPAAADRALVRALNKTADWLQGRAARAVSAEMSIAVKHLRKRMRVARASKGQRRALLWAGLNPIPAVAFGRPRQTRTGVTVGRRAFRSAFVATVKGRIGVYRRADHLTRWTKDRPHTSSPNLPIEAVTVPLGEQAARAIEALLPEVSDRLLKTLERELNYEVNVRG